jgi:hypothetical protein
MIPGNASGYYVSGGLDPRFGSDATAERRTSDVVVLAGPGGRGRSVTARAAMSGRASEKVDGMSKGTAITIQPIHRKRSASLPRPSTVPPR